MAIRPFTTLLALGCLTIASRQHTSLAFQPRPVTTLFPHHQHHRPAAATATNDHSPSRIRPQLSLTPPNGSDNPYFSVETTADGPKGSPVHTLTFHTIPGQAADVPPTTIQTGKMGRLASSALTTTRGDTVLYTTCARDDDPKDIDFCPLSVEHSERFSAAGLTSGAFNKRDGRPNEHEILTCRLMDRPIRPLIHPGWRHETQLLSWVLSYDGLRSCDPLAVCASAAALYVSDVPLRKPVAAVQVGLVKLEDDDDDSEGTFVVNPTVEQMEQSRLRLTVAGTKDAVLMIEGEADFLPEQKFIEAIQVGHDAVIAFCDGFQALSDVMGVEKYLDTIQEPPAGIQERVNAVMTERVDAMYGLHGDKRTNGRAMGALYDDIAELDEEFPDEKTAIKAAFKNLLCQRMFANAKEHGLRGDGRRIDEIRHLDMETGLLPKVHGSALFTRGETQALATATLGDSGMQQKIDKISGMMKKRFYLQYTFPPSCVGETGRVGMPGRREVGHGNLAERALVPCLPTEEDFPYSIRVESLVTESHGSSSMASVCGGCLALMDAGVPIKRPVAGIAMGMLLGDKNGLSDEDAIVLSDITGTEDALGTMDFKVAGDRNGVTTFQLDIKCEGLTLATMARALEQARVGRIHILDEMDKVMDAPRTELPATVPKMLSFKIDPDTIGKVIGPGGKQIRAIIEDFELTGMDVKEEGDIQLSSFDAEKMTKAEEFVKALVAGGGGGGRGERKERVPYEGPPPVEGQTYTGPIKGIQPFGVFVEILPGAEDGSSPGLEGLVHVSELARERVRNCEGFIKSMGVDTLTVKYIGQDRGKAKLSRKAVLEDREKPAENTPPPPVMSTDEVDVIAKAIEGITDL